MTRTRFKIVSDLLCDLPNSLVHRRQVLNAIFGLATGYYASIKSARLAIGDVGPKIINVQDFDIKADGETDNGVALERLRDDLISENRHRHYQIIFPPGIYRYSNNRWLYGLTNVTLVGYEASLQNISKQRYVNHFNPFPRQGIFSLMGDVSPERNSRGSAEIFVSGDKIASVGATANVLQLLTNKMSHNYTPGTRVIVHGFARQARGYSPNLLFYEFAEIVKFDDNNLFLKNPLNNGYNQDWPDLIYTGESIYDDVIFPKVRFGSARVLPIDDRKQISGTFYYPRRLELRGLSFKRNPFANHAIQSLALVGQHIVLRDLNLADNEDFNLYVRESENTEINNCTVGNIVEFDKIVGEISLTKSKILRRQAAQPHALKAGTSVQKINIQDSEISGRINVVALDHLIVNGNKIDSRHLPDQAYWGGLSFYNGTFGGRKALIKNNLFVLRSRQNPIMESTNVQFFEVNFIDSDIISLGDLESSQVDEAHLPKIIRSFWPGRAIYLDMDFKIKRIMKDIRSDRYGQCYLDLFPLDDFEQRLGLNYIYIETIISVVDFGNKIKRV